MSIRGIVVYGAPVAPEPDEHEQLVTRTFKVERPLWDAVVARARRRGENASVVIRRALLEYQEADAPRERIPHAS